MKNADIVFMAFFNDSDPATSLAEWATFSPYGTPAPPPPAPGQSWVIQDRFAKDVGIPVVDNQDPTSTLQFPDVNGLTEDPCLYIGGGEMQFLAGLQIEPIDHSGDGLRRR